MDRGLNSSIGTSSVIPSGGVGKRKQYTRFGTVGESRPTRGKQLSLGCRIGAGNPGAIVESSIRRQPPGRDRVSSKFLEAVGFRCFQFRKEVSSLFVHYWDWLHSQENISRKRAIKVSRGVLEDLLLALCHLPLMLFDLRLRTSPLVLAGDASATGLGVCRTSSLEPKGLLALAAFQEGHKFHGEGIGLIEVGTTPGGVRQVFARLKVKPGAHAIVGAKNESKRIILQTWPDVIVSDACTGLTDIVVKEQKANRPAFGQQQASSRKSLPPLHRAMPEYSVETLFATRNSLSNTTRVSVSELHRMKPIAFRLTGASSAEQIFYWGILEDQRKRSRKNHTRGVEIDWIDVQVNKFTPSHNPRRSKSQKQRPIIPKEVNFGFPPDYTLPCQPTSAVKARPKELESVRWSILATTGHPKCAAALVKNLLHMIGIITDDTSIANNDTQPDEMRHDIDIVKELVRSQTH